MITQVKTFCRNLIFSRNFTDFPLAVVLINEKTELKKKLKRSNIILKNGIKSGIETVVLVTFTEEILNGKLHLLSSVSS